VELAIVHIQSSRLLATRSCPALASRVSRSGYQLGVFAEGPEGVSSGREPTMEETEEMEVLTGMVASFRMFLSLDTP
jgi:hypothetical protein